MPTAIYNRETKEWERNDPVSVYEQAAIDIMNKDKIEANEFGYLQACFGSHNWKAFKFFCKQKKISLDLKSLGHWEILWDSFLEE